MDRAAKEGEKKKLRHTLRNNEWTIHFFPAVEIMRRLETPN
jgi:hypothetical protein